MSKVIALTRPVFWLPSQDMVLLVLQETCYAVALLFAAYDVFLAVSASVWRVVSLCILVILWSNLAAKTAYPDWEGQGKREKPSVPLASDTTGYLRALRVRTR